MKVDKCTKCSNEAGPERRMCARCAENSRKYLRKSRACQRAFRMEKSKKEFVTLPGEKWKPVPLNDHYHFSNYGRIRSDVSGILKLLKPYPTPTREGDIGYLCFDIRVDGKRIVQKVHQLVAEGFIGLRPVGKVPNHKDLKKHNNYFGNLEYVTPSENTRHAILAGRRCKLTSDEVKIIFLSKNRERGKTRTALAKRFGVSVQAISHIWYGRSWGWLTAPLGIEK